MTENEEYQFMWNSGHLTVRVGVTFRPGWHIFDHLSICSLEPAKARLPITETGYLSHYLAAGAVAASGGAVAVVRAILDEAAESEEWQEYLVDSRQSSLF